MVEGVVRGPGGVDLHLREWRPSAAPRGGVVLVHDFHGHGGLYDWAADRLVGHGYVTYAHDLRGHGRSAGPRAFCQDLADHTADLDAVVSHVRKKQPGLPLFLLGQGAGSVVACQYLLHHQDRLAGFLSSGGTHELALPGLTAALVRALHALAPQTHVLRLQPEELSRDPEYIRRIVADGTVLRHAATAGFLVTWQAGQADRWRSFEVLNLPLLVLHGSADTAARLEGSTRLYESASSDDKTMKTYEGHHHDLLNDLGRDVVMDDILDWVETRTMPVTAF